MPKRYYLKFILLNIYLHFGSGSESEFLSGEGAAALGADEAVWVEPPAHRHANPLRNRLETHRARRGHLANFPLFVALGTVDAVICKKRN